MVGSFLVILLGSRQVFAGMILILGLFVFSPAQVVQAVIQDATFRRGDNMKTAIIYGPRDIRVEENSDPCHWTR